MKILNVPVSSISEVKKSPMDIFSRANNESSGVYIFNREKVAGVMLTQEQYESLTLEAEQLRETVADLLVEKRLLMEEVATYSDQEVRGDRTNRKPTIDEEDGWE